MQYLIFVRTPKRKYYYTHFIDLNELFLEVIWPFYALKKSEAQKGQITFKNNSS